MSLNWNFKTDKIGYAEKEGYPEHIHCNIYSGNALAIFINENDNDSTYSLENFFGDVPHMKRCTCGGRIKDWDGYKTYPCNDYSQYYKHVYLDVNYKYACDIAEAFAKSGVPVTLYNPSKEDK